MKMMFIVSPLIRVYALVLTVNLGVLTTGMSLAWSSPSLVKLRNPNETPLSRPLTDEEGSWVVAGGFLIAIFTNVLGGMFIDVVGRKNFILLATVPKILCALILIFANEVWIFIFSRAVMVVVDSLILIVVPIYSSEMATKDHRSALGSFLQFFSSLGVLFTLSVGPFMSYKNYNIILTCVITVLSVPLFLLPDTPFHIYSKGRHEEALRVLTTIRGSQILAKEELEEYKTTESKTEKKIEKSTLLKNKTFLKAMSLGFVLGAGSQLIGSNAINFYLQTILESTKTNVPSEIASVIIGIIQVLASFSTTLIMNSFGRRTILLTSLVGILFGMLGLGTFFELTFNNNDVINGLMNYLPIISLILVIFCYNVGIGSLLWVVTSELFEGPSRAIGVSISITSSTVLIFFTTKYFAIMTAALGPASTYWLFCIMCVILFIIIAIFMPETKGKTFGEIQIALGDNIEINHVTLKDKSVA